MREAALLLPRSSPPARRPHRRRQRRSQATGSASVQGTARRLPFPAAAASRSGATRSRRARLRTTSSRRRFRRSRPAGTPGRVVEPVPKRSPATSGRRGERRPSSARVGAPGRCWSDRKPRWRRGSGRRHVPVPGRCARAQRHARHAADGAAARSPGMAAGNARRAPPEGRADHRPMISTESLRPQS